MPVPSSGLMVSLCTTGSCLAASTPDGASSSASSTMNQPVLLPFVSSSADTTTFACSIRWCSSKVSHSSTSPNKLATMAEACVKPWSRVSATLCRSQKLPKACCVWIEAKRALPERLYFMSNSTTLSAALCPSSTTRREIHAAGSNFAVAAVSSQETSNSLVLLPSKTSHSSSSMCPGITSGPMVSSTLLMWSSSGISAGAPCKLSKYDIRASTCIMCARIVAQSR
mmetsp:Transcript_66017/g.123115  ORF Transcript_66017/g.123115 Transcript_66017/m.123115 type:complete len:226 (-) Transcript_66017:225-902(-)